MLFTKVIDDSYEDDVIVNHYSVVDELYHKFIEFMGNHRIISANYLLDKKHGKYISIDMKKKQVSYHFKELEQGIALNNKNYILNGQYMSKSKLPMIT